jgi:hypothetical protein
VVRNGAWGGGAILDVGEVGGGDVPAIETGGGGALNAGVAGVVRVAVAVDIGEGVEGEEVSGDGGGYTHFVGTSVIGGEGVAVEGGVRGVVEVTSKEQSVGVWGVGLQLGCEGGKEAALGG